VLLNSMVLLPATQYAALRKPEYVMVVLQALFDRLCGMGYLWSGVRRGTLNYQFVGLTTVTRWVSPGT